MNKLFLHTVTTLSFVLQSCHYGTGVGETRPTPKEFLSLNKVSQVQYQQDKEIIKRQIQAFLLGHSNSFYSKEYFDSTLLGVDTILYSEDKNKVAVFVFTKNPTSRQLAPNPQYQWYYNAYCYLGKRQNDTFNLRWLNRFYPINFYDQKEVTTLLRQMYFNEFATLKNADGKYTYDVNLDDKRFWNSFVWKQYFEKK